MSPISQSSLYLPEQEFSDIYQEVRKTVGAFAKSSAVDDTELMRKAEELAKRTGNAEVRFDFSKGFIPLFSALAEAKSRGPDVRDGESSYTVRFEE